MANTRRPRPQKATEAPKGAPTPRRPRKTAQEPPESQESAPQALEDMPIEQQNEVLRGEVGFLHEWIDELQAINAEQFAELGRLRAHLKQWESGRRMLKPAKRS